MQRGPDLHVLCSRSVLLTEDAYGDEHDGRVRRRHVAAAEERDGQVVGDGQRLDGVGRRADEEEERPHAEEGGDRAEGVEQEGELAAGLGVAADELDVAEGAAHRDETAEGPEHHGPPHRAIHPQQHTL